MKESLDKAYQELKRADHLIYVSLKYTRTVDVIKSVIERLINAFDFGINTLFEFAKKKNKIKDIPVSPKQKCEELLRIFKKESELKEFVDFYTLLRRLNKASFRRELEYRRHVVMIADLDGEEFRVDIDLIYEFFEKTKKFVEYIREKAKVK